MNNLGIFDAVGRERIADWVMHGNGRFYQRHEIQVRIVKLLGKIAGEIEQLLTEKRESDAAEEFTGNRRDVHTQGEVFGLPVRSDVRDHDAAR